MKSKYVKARLMSFIDFFKLLNDMSLDIEEQYLLLLLKKRYFDKNISINDLQKIIPNGFALEEVMKRLEIKSFIIKSHNEEYMLDKNKLIKVL